MRSSPTLAVYAVAYSLPLGGVDRDFSFTEDGAQRHFLYLSSNIIYWHNILLPLDLQPKLIFRMYDLQSCLSKNLIFQFPTFKICWLLYLPSHGYSIFSLLFLQAIFHTMFYISSVLYNSNRGVCFWIVISKYSYTMVYKHPWWGHLKLERFLVF